MDMDRLDVIRIWYGEINNIKRVILGIMHKRCGTSVQSSIFTICGFMGCVLDSFYQNICLINKQKALK